MTPQALKASILQLAIQGKLVPQRPEEGTAEELYQQIQAEKQRLIAEGTIKREKTLAPIKEDEIPFDIPETWKWVRLGEICLSIGAGMTPLKSNPDFYTEGTIPWILTGDLPDEEIYDAPNKVTEYALQHTSLQLKPCGSVLIAMYGATIGKLGILTFPACMNQACCCLQPHPSVVNKYLFHYLWSIRPALKSSGEGGAQPNISKEKLLPRLIPLPPLEEQKRIVAKIEEMLPLIDRYGEAYTELKLFNKRFPDDLRKSILQEAIQGKLVPQLPEEGTAEELYQQIQAEKKRLIAAGTIKKEKPLPPIEEKDLPLDIPETWKWVRLGDVCRMDLGKTPPRAETEWWDGTIPWVSIADMLEGGHISTTKESVSSKAISCVFSEKISKAGTLLMSFKLTIGRVSILDIDAVHNEAIVSIYPHHDQERAFQHYLFSVLPLISKEGNFKNAIKGKTLNKRSLNNLLLPLPPLAEQKRIVAKIEETLTLCKALK